MKRAISFDDLENLQSQLAAANARVEKLVEALTALRNGFLDGSIEFTKKRQANSDPYHPANVSMVAALAEQPPSSVGEIVDSQEE